MKFIEYSNFRMQELRMKEAQDEATGNFSPINDAEFKALYQISKIYFFILKWMLVPFALISFLLVSIGLKRKPIPVITDKIKADKEAKRVADAMLKANPPTPTTDAKLDTIIDSAQAPPTSS